MWHSVKYPLSLLQKYNKPGPRYTSYPTAPHFNDSVTVADWEDQIAINNRTNDRDLSLYFHIPFCDALCWFCGCTTIITRKREKIEEYVGYLSKEIDLVKQRLHPDRKVVQMHWGGGTPTYLSPDQILCLGSKCNRSFKFLADAEIACEMDPRELTREHILALREVGFNRASIGVQDFDPAVQIAVNRINSKDLIREVTGWIREAGFQSLNFDLIYGLPLQTTTSFEKTLKDILEISPDRFAVYSYAHVPWIKPHQKLIKECDLPSPEEKLAMQKMIVEILISSGYVYIGMDHFAKEDDELAVAQREKTLQRNFQGYSTKSGADIYAMGISSISQLRGAYAQNYKEIPAYYQKIDEGILPFEKGFILSEDDQIRKTVIMRLMCDMELDYTYMSNRLGIDFQVYFRDELKRIQEFELDELIICEPRKLVVTETGRLFIRIIAMVFDKYLGKSQAKYSMTI